MGTRTVEIRLDRRCPEGTEIPAKKGGRGKESEENAKTPENPVKIVFYKMSTGRILSQESHPPCVERASEAA